MSAELRAYKGNPTHGKKGVHLGYWDEDAKCPVILCGLSTINENECRCSPWNPISSTELTCRECYEKGKALHDAKLRVRLVLAAIRPQPRSPGPSVHRLPHPAAGLVA